MIIRRVFRGDRGHPEALRHEAGVLRLQAGPVYVSSISILAYSTYVRVYIYIYICIHTYIHRL